MYSLKQEVKDFLNDTPIWTISTVGKNGPNGIPTRMHTLLEDGKLFIANVWMEITPENIKEDNRVCISVFQTPAEGRPVGYLLKGTAEFVKEGPYNDIALKMTQSQRDRGITPKGGAIVFTPETVVHGGPSPAAGKEV